MTVVIDGTLGIDTIQANTVTSAKIVDGSVAAVDLAQPLTLGTAQNTTSGTSIDFTGIPSWVKRITVMFNGVSTSGVSNLIVQLGSGSIAASGYTSDAGTISGTSAASNTSSIGFIVSYNNSAAASISGVATLNLIGSNTWINSAVTRYSASSTTMCGGSVSLSGTLDRIRITSGNGTDTFDAGSVNIMYEG